MTFLIKGLSVALHLLSPISEGLFQRAILQSGTAITPGWGPNSPQKALEYADMFTKNLGCDANADVLSCLQVVKFLIPSRKWNKQKKLNFLRTKLWRKF